MLFTTTTHPAMVIILQNSFSSLSEKQSAHIVLLSKVTSFLNRARFSRSGFFLYIQRLLVRLLYRHKTVGFDGLVFRVHQTGEYISRKLILFHGFEKAEIAHLCSLAKKGDTVVDVGANIGFYTIYFSKAVGPQGTVLAFEPDPENIKLLRENVKLNRCTNVKIFPFALGNADTTEKLFLCSENKGYQSLADLAHTGQYIEIGVKEARTALAGYNPTIAKIDVEGAEPLVWQGMDVKPPNILFEFVPSQIRALGNDPCKFLESIAQDGYKLYLFDADQLVPVTPEKMTNLADSTGADYNMFAQK